MRISDKKVGNQITFIVFIERVASLSEPDELMTYGDATDIKAMRREVKHCTEHVSNLGCQKHYLHEYAHLPPNGTMLVMLEEILVDKTLKVLAKCTWHMSRLSFQFLMHYPSHTLHLSLTPPLPPLPLTTQLNTSQDRPLGVEIEGGSDTESPYVKIAAIAPGSVAERCGMLRVGDELVEVDEVPIVGATHSQALDIIQGVSRPVTVTVQRREDFDLEARIRPPR